MFAGSAYGVGRLHYENARSAVMGTGEGLTALLIDGTSRERSPRWWVEAGERDLFGSTGLRVAQLLTGVRRRQAMLLLSTAVLDAPPGREYAAAAEVLYGAAGSVVLSAEVGLWALRMDGTVPAHLACVGAAVSAPVFTNIAAAYRVDNIRVAGEPLRGADTSVMVVATPSPAVSVVAGLRLTRDGESGAWVGSHLRWGGRIESAVGYDDGTGMLKSSLAIHAVGCELGIGASSHPVLGLSKSIFLRWVAK